MLNQLDTSFHAGELRSKVLRDLIRNPGIDRRFVTHRKAGIKPAFPFIPTDEDGYSTSSPSEYFIVSTSGLSPMPCSS